MNWSVNGMLGAIALTTDEIVSQARALWQNLFGLTKLKSEKLTSSIREKIMNRPLWYGFLYKPTLAMKGRAIIVTSHFAAESKSKTKRKRGVFVLSALIRPTHCLTLRFFPKTDWSIHNPAIRATGAIAAITPSLY
jgi:hypothetical protein